MSRTAPTATKMSFPKEDATLSVPAANARMRCETRSSRGLRLMSSCRKMTIQRLPAKPVPKTYRIAFGDMPPSRPVTSPAL